MELSDHGMIIQNDSQNKIEVGVSFIVDAKTGRISGPDSISTGDRKGSIIAQPFMEGDTYRVLYHYEARDYFVTLEIAVPLHSGANKPEKVFLYKGIFQEVVTGECRVN